MAYTAIATTTAGRKGHVESSDGNLKHELTMPGLDKAGATNPEQLFAAGYSACFGQAVIAIGAKSEVKPTDVHITAEVTLNATPSHEYSLAVVLKGKIDGLDHAQAEAIMQKAHEMCPYSKAVRGNIPVEIVTL